MPKKKTHRQTGKWVGILTPITLVILIQSGILPPALFQGQPSLFGGLLWWIICYPLVVFLSMVGALLADIIEPAEIGGPSHRGFFHSHWFLLALSLLTIGLLLGWILGGSESYYVRNILFFLSVGYLSHLILDAIF